MASCYGHDKVAKILLDNSAEIDARDFVLQQSSLMIASSCGHAQTASLLLERGASVNLQDSEGEGVLMAATRSGHQDLVGKLLEAGAEVNLYDKNGWSSLMYAIATDDIFMSNLLYANGACACNSAGDNIFDICSLQFLTSSLGQNMVSFHGFICLV